MVTSLLMVCSFCLGNEADARGFLCYKIAVDSASKFRAKIFFATVLLASAVLITQPNGFAHGEMHDRIAALTVDISQHPKRAELFLRRAELHRLHGEWTAALADCQSAENVNPDLISAQLCRGKILFDAGRFAEARTALDQVLAKENQHSEGFLTRARILAKLEDFENAAADFTKAIQLASVPEPDFYLERAQAWQAAGKLETALAGIDDGITKLGPIASLEIPAIELELKLQRYDSALHRVDLLAAQSQRKETWLLKRGEVLEKAGRLSEAKETYANAAEALALLPPRFKQSEPTKRLENQLMAARQRLRNN